MALISNANELDRGPAAGADDDELAPAPPAAASPRSRGGKSPRGNPASKQGKPGSGRRQDAREEFSFNRKFVPVNLDLSPSSVKKSADEARDRQSQRDLRTVFDRLDIKRDRKIDEEEIEVLLKGLGYDPQPGEAKDIIWEVDDSRHGGLTWNDFHAVYNRVRHDQYGMEPRRMYTIIEFCLFDLDASGVVGLNEVMEMFYRRYGRIAALDKREMSGFLTFRQFVKRDTSFYSLSRQIEDSRQPPSRSRTRQMLAELREDGISMEEATAAASPAPSAGTRSPRANSRGGGSSSARQGLQHRAQLNVPSPRGNWRSHSGRPTRAQEKENKKTARATAKRAEQERAATELQAPDWKSMTREELKHKARAEAEDMLQQHNLNARERARKASDMTKQSALSTASSAEQQNPRYEDGRLMIPVFPEIQALQERHGGELDSEKPISWQDGLATLREEAAVDEYRPPSRILYGHHGLKQPAGPAGRTA